MSEKQMKGCGCSTCFAYLEQFVYPIQGTQDVAVRAPAPSGPGKDESWGFGPVWGVTKLGLVALSERWAGEGHLDGTARCGHGCPCKDTLRGWRREWGWGVSPGITFLKFPSRAKWP